MEKRRNFRIRIPGGIARVRTDAACLKSDIWDIAFGGVALDALLDAELGGLATVELHWPGVGIARVTARVIRLDRGTGRTALRFVDSNRGLRDLVAVLARWPLRGAGGGHIPGS